MRSSAMIDRYRWYEVLGIYAGVAVFLAFVLALILIRSYPKAAVLGFVVGALPWME
jgi:hypothetical protein